MVGNFDLVAIGNATIDTFLTIRSSNKHFRINKETGEICVKQGDKAIVDKLDFFIGGNAANVSVGLSRMGFKSAITAEIGSDEFTQKIVNGLKKEGVSEILLKLIPNTPSPLSVIINYKGERTIFCEDVEKDHDFNFEGIFAKWIYLTSLGNKWQEAYKRTLIFAKTVGAKIAFNPGTSQLDKGIESIRDVLKETDILFVNKEEAKTITGTKTDDIEKLLNLLDKLGPKTSVITDGLKGAFLFDKNDGFFFQKAYNEKKALERTGAGDAFASGFLSAILFGKSAKQAMGWGALNSASVVAKIGAQAGLLTINEIKEKL